jgi:hypothetical protein
MPEALWLLAAMGLVGAYDTLWFHEWRGRLVARPGMRTELRLHVARDAIYVVLFGTLPLLAWQGWWVLPLIALLGAEIVITLADFVTEDRVRTSLGGVYAGERVTHAVMGIIYGAMLAFLVPVLVQWADAPTDLVASTSSAPSALTGALLLAAAGIALHGMRDLAAVLAVPGSDWPWAGRT